MLSKAYKKAPDLLSILLIGLLVEGANFESTFFKFMNAYRPEYGPVNHFFSLLLASFILLNIVHWGLRGVKELSWGLAVLAMVISFAVYANMELRWDFSNFSEIHLVVLILSIVLPGLVAFTTHRLRQVIMLRDEKEEWLRQINRDTYRADRPTSESRNLSYPATIPFEIFRNGKKSEAKQDYTGKE